MPISLSSPEIFRASLSACRRCLRLLGMNAYSRACQGGRMGVGSVSAVFRGPSTVNRCGSLQECRERVSCNASTVGYGKLLRASDKKLCSGERRNAQCVVRRIVIWKVAAYSSGSTCCSRILEGTGRLVNLLRATIVTEIQ
ncbi:hypothetical protein KC331_g23 [Hortaea werneckii]|nr:hypothetical protein KC331_g23 [Hortaea werneckii]